MASYKDIQGFNIQNLTADPDNASAVGQIYYNSTTGSFKAVKAGGVTIGTWASAASLNTAGSEGGGAGTATASLVFGRYRSSGPPFGITESYNGTAWTELGDIPNGSLYNGAGAGTQTAAMYMGGQDSARRNYVWNFDGTSWSPGTALNAVRSSNVGGGTQTAAITTSGSGAAPTYPNLAITEVWNGSTWTEVADLNSGRGAGSGCGTTTSFIMMGGSNPSVTAVTEVWNGSSWTEVNDLNTARNTMGSSGLLSTSNVLVFGGANYPTYYGNTESWDGTSWTEVNDLGTARFWLNKNASTTDGFAVSGEITVSLTNVEEFSYADFEIKTLTTS